MTRLRRRIAGSASKNEPAWLAPFEIYDDFGRFRSEESLEHPENLISKGPEKAPVHVDLRDIYKTQPIHAVGHLEDERLESGWAGCRCIRSGRANQRV